MPSFGKRSRDNIATLCEELQRLNEEAIKSTPMDYAVICGHRGEEEQTAAFNSGKSTVKFPNSRHNSEPAEAFDFVPWHKGKPHVRWGDINAFSAVARHLKKTAYKLGIEIEWGGDWRTFKDYPHIQIKR